MRPSKDEVEKTKPKTSGTNQNGASPCNNLRNRIIKLLQVVSAYTVFYAILIGLFASVYWTYDAGFSASHGQGGSIFLKGKPGMQHFPIAPEEDAYAIWYSKSTPKSIRKYTKQLADIVNLEYKLHKTHGIEYVTCDPYKTPYTPTQELQVKRFGLKPNEACRAFDKNLDWGPCTPLGRNIRPDERGPFNLTEDAFGFESGRPCFILQLNRVINWIPNRRVAITEESNKRKYPKSAKKALNKYKAVLQNLPRSTQAQSIWILCDGKTKEDRDLMGTLEYYPKSHPGIPKKAFPFRNEKGYLVPFIFLRFLNPSISVLLQIECYAYDDKIEINPDIGSGTTSFELLIDD